MIEYQNEKHAPVGNTLESIAPIRLSDVRTVSTEFGYLFRHYWVPATELHYATVVEQTMRGERSARRTCSFTQRMVRCDSDVCVWLETICRDEAPLPVGLSAWDVSWARGYLCVYNRSSQTLRYRMEVDEEQSVDDKEARNLAFLRQPILTPLLPVPLGFSWHVANGEGHLDYTLRQANVERGMPLLRVDRSGLIVLDRIFRDGLDVPGRYLVRRTGWTLYAPGRSIIVEDRVSDRILQAEGWSELAGMETETKTTLVRSVLHEDDAGALAPLVVKYKTRSGNRYVYDCGTGRILKVDEAVYRMIDEDRIQSNDAISLQEESVVDARAAIDRFIEKGYFAPHPPTELGRVEKVAFRDRVHDLDVFWRQNAMLLVLGITERCNLCCEYCCFSGKFEGQRTHGPRSMAFETARKAIREYLENGQIGDGTCPITFYGGEPLLEFHLLRECVRYAVELSGFLDKKVSFAVTTNGTLLDDETVDFLVEHDFLILISLDGPKHCHDRYRVTASGEGSFDRVERNLRRFVQRYPDYRKRGLNVTLAPPLDLEATDRFLADCLPDFPVSRASLVNTGPEHRFRTEQETPTRFGCHRTTACDGKSNVASDAFRRMEDADLEGLRSLWHDCMEAIAEHGVVETAYRLPLGMLLFGQQISFYHHRTVTKQAPEQHFFVPCLPGFSRRYCDVDGNYRVCERVDDSEMYVLGNVHDGPDVRKMQRIMESRRQCGDCGNCPALRTCDACFARIPGDVAAGTATDPLFDLQCQRTRETTKRLFQAYTEIMERNPRAFDRPALPGNDPASELKFGGAPNRIVLPALEGLDWMTY